MNQMRVETEQVVGPLLRQFVRLAHRIEQRLDGVVQPLGLSLPKLAVLQHLVQAERPLPLSELSAHLGCAKSNMTQLIDRLEADQLVERQPDATDRRARLAAITARGRRQYAEGQRLVAAEEQAILAGVPAPDREHLARVLAEFNRHLGL